MQKNKFTNYIHLLTMLMVMSFVCVGCTKEDLADCKPYTHEFTLYVNPADGDSTSIKEIQLYVYDANENFLATHQAQLGKNIQLSYPNNNNLNIVALGNAASNTQTAPTPNLGDALSATALSLITHTRAAEQLAISPDDLFKGSQEVVNTAIAPQKIYIKRKVASVVITAKGLRTAANNTANNYHYTLRYGKSELNFKGHTSGSNVMHTPEATFDSGILESSIFNILPATAPLNTIEIDIFNGTTLITTITADDSGTPLIANVGELLNVYANFGDGTTGNVSVSIETTPWGEKKVWKEF